ncbi:MAG TPA: hypothetical protein VMT26_05180 [Candidatus Bathyarchaeia archaeon]|nr:hypothetical protein [Candidatus Bathyarchaeia archaeon]
MEWRIKKKAHVECADYGKALKHASTTRALDMCEQHYANTTAVPVAAVENKFPQTNPAYQTEIEQKRAMAVVYFERNQRRPF